jgi:hypothetical protein
MSGGAGGGAVGSAKTPADFLKSIRGRPVVVKLNSGVDYRGMLYAPVVFIAIFCVFPLVSVSPIYFFLHIFSPLGLHCSLQECLPRGSWIRV